jgi:hypothetical protein
VLPSDASTKYALITCLDSDPTPASLCDTSCHLKPLVGKLQSFGSGLLIPTELLLENEKDNQIFFGFDEVWFFPDKRIEPKPESMRLVGPTRLDQESFEGLW